MTQETATYLTNIVIGAILAVLATHYWWRHREADSLRYWILAAWVLTLADVLFAARPLLPHALGRLLPTLGVTVGHAVMLLAAQQTAGRPRRQGLASGLVFLHTVALILFVLQEQPSNWRMVTNGVIWGGFSLASAWTLRQGARQFWGSLTAPASVFVAHAAFHGLRVVCAALFETGGWAQATAVLQVLGDLEVSFFMVALFVGLLLSYLQLRHEELMSAHAEVQTLSGLLPMCAWCKKVRDDEGYWEQVEDYLSRRSQLKFTHSVCVDCLDDVRRREGLALPAR